MWTPLRTVFGIDLRSLAAFRVMIAVYILVDLANRWPYLTQFYTDAGILSRAESMLYNHAARWSVFYLSGEPFVAHALFSILLIAAFCLLVGYRTRLATFVCWVLVVSLTNRNLFILQGDDDLSCLLLFWGLFLPLGARFSIDDALRKDHEGAVSAPDVRGHAYFSPASVAAVLQVSYVYVFGAFLKKGPEWHEELNAVYYALSAESVSTVFGDMLLKVDAIHTPLTAFVWWLELLMPLYIFMPIFFHVFRITGLALLIGMHLGFAIFLSVGLFPLCSIASLSLLIPAAVWQWFDARKAKGDWALFYDEGCTFCLKTCLILRSFCLPYNTAIRPAQSDAVAGPILERETSWVVAHPDGQLLTHWEAVVAVLKNNPLTWPIGVLAGLMPARAGRAFYNSIGNSRSGLGALTQTMMPFRALPQTLNNGVTAFVIVCTVFVFLWNVHRDPQSGLELPEEAEHVAKFMRLNQRWGMFAPTPIKREGWYGFEGTLENGLHVDLWTQAPGYPPADAPEDLRAWNKDYRWRKYFTRLHAKPYARQRRHLARYWCRQSWVDANGTVQPLASVKMTFYSRRTMPDKRPDQLQTYNLYNRKCN